MRNYKSDNLVLMLVLTIAGVMSTAKIQAQEIMNNQSLDIITIPTHCIDMRGRNIACLSGRDIIPGIKEEALHAHYMLWQSYRLSQENIPTSDLLSALEDRRCEMHNLPQSSLNTDYADPISLSRYLTFDFAMDDINHFESSGIYVGFKNCW